MDCAQVRDLLPECSLGVTGARDSAAVERHIALCAACRKEARELAAAAATLAFALAPATADPELGRQVTMKVREAAGSSRPPRMRRRRSTAVLLAATLLVATAGAAVLADLENPPPDAAQLDALAKQEALGQFSRFLEGAEFADPDARAFLGLLAPRKQRTEGSGSALTITSPALDDRVIVIVSGMTMKAGASPLVVSLQDEEGHVAVIGRISALDTGGGATVGRVTARDLTGFLQVLVRNGKGRVLLEGTLEAQTSVASPAP